MKCELPTRHNQAVVLISRMDLYVIIAVPGVSTSGCTCVLAYSFTNCDTLKRNAEEMRQYVSAFSSEPLNRRAAARTRLLVKAASRQITPVLLLWVPCCWCLLAVNHDRVWRRSAVHVGLAAMSPRVVRSADDTFPAMSKREATGSIDYVPHRSAVSGDLSLTVPT
ncbi:hypothetical protein HPB50_012573 [Hyalomma asiaticum]|uniref:Uncharacterized protein n=1 Tax=Hyalomma asiaticum TaxID=266040 RepID=A0ACB7S290_HYAAI|nr:hypothetical protein HPB50_012573 [Hyalomma asiaticum]